MTTQPILAAILAEKDVAVDPLLASVAARAGERGLKVAGFCNTVAPIPTNAAGKLLLNGLAAAIGKLSRNRSAPARAVAGSIRQHLQMWQDRCVPKSKPEQIC